MGYEIARGSAKFLYGIRDLGQLKQILKEKRDCAALSFIGRSNVGKSSLINALFGKGAARTSKTPGRTREINMFSFNLALDGTVDTSHEFYLFDLPGYGYANVSQQMSREWGGLMENFFQHSPPANGMVLLQDARHPMQKADLEFYKYFHRFSFNSSLVLNKLDKLKTQKDRSKLNKMKPAIYQENKWVQQIFFVSAEKRNGIDELHNSLVSQLLLHHTERGQE